MAWVTNPSHTFVWFDDRATYDLAFAGYRTGQPYPVYNPAVLAQVRSILQDNIGWTRGGIGPNEYFALQVWGYWVPQGALVKDVNGPGAAQQRGYLLRELTYVPAVALGDSLPVEDQPEPPPIITPPPPVSEPPPPVEPPPTPPVEEQPPAEDPPPPIVDQPNHPGPTPPPAPSPPPATPATPSSTAEIKIPVGGLPLNLPFADIIDQLINPGRTDADALRRSIAGDVGSLAWALTDYEGSPSKRIGDLVAQLQHGLDSGQGINLAGLIAGLGGVANSIAGPGGNLANILAGTTPQLVEGLGAPIAAGLGGVANPLTALQGMFDPPSGDLADMYRMLMEELQASTTASVRTLQGTGELLEPATLQGVDGRVQGSTGDAIWALISIALAGGNAIGPWLNRLLQAGKKVSGPAATLMANEVVQGSASTAAQIAAMAALPAVLNGAAFSEPAAVLGGVNQAFQNIFRVGNELMISALDSGDPQVPEDAQPRAANALSIAMSMGLSAHLSAVLLERFAPGKALGINQLSAFLGDMAAFNPLSNAVWNHLVDSAVGRPLQQYYNKRYPTRLPNFGEIFGMGRKHEYDADPRDPVTNIPQGFIDDMLLQGVQPRWIERYWRFMWADPTLMTIVRIADTSEPPATPDPEALRQLPHYAIDVNDPDWWFKLKFKKAGYDDSDMEVLTHVAKDRIIATDRTRTLTQLRNALAKGYISEDGYREAAASLAEARQAVEMSIVEVRRRRLNDIADDMVKVITDTYLAGFTDIETFREWLAQYIVEPEMLNAAVVIADQQRNLKAIKAERSDVDKQRSAVRTAALQAYRAQFDAGALDEAGFRGALVAVGYSDELAGYTVQAELSRQQAKLATKLAAAVQAEQSATLRTLQQAYETQFADGVLDADGLKAALATAGMGDALAGAVVARASAAKVKRLHEAAAAEQLRLDRAADAEAKRQVDAVAAVARAEAAKLETTTIARLRADYRAGNLDGGALLAALVTAGVPADRAEQIAGEELAARQRTNDTAAAQAAARDAARLESANITALRAQFRANVIDQAALQTQLRQVGATPGEAAAIVAEELARRKLDTDRAAETEHAKQVAAAAAAAKKAKAEALATAEKRARDQAAAAQKAERDRLALQVAEVRRLEAAFIARQQALVRAKLIDPQQMLQALTLAGIPEPRARELAAAEAAKLGTLAEGADLPLKQGPVAPYA
jgi:hypothetical protein